MPRTLTEGCPVIDYPRQDETILSREYTMRVSTPEDAEAVEVSIDQGPWQLCRKEAGYWWFDWRGYEPGEHELVVRSRNGIGKTRVSEPQECKVDFNGGRMQVKRYMTKGVECADPSLTLKEAADRMRKLEIGVLAVCDKDKLVGIVTDRDIVVRAVCEGADPRQMKVKDAMTKDPAFCYEDQEIHEAAKAMERKKIRRIPVMNRQNQLAGLLSLGDFTKDGEGQGIVAEVLEAVAVRH